MNDLETVVSNPEAHGHFLNRLAYLEKQGFKKLLKFKNAQGTVDEGFMKHLSDEARHSHHLQREALRLQLRGEIDLQTKNYLTRLEVFILRWMRGSGRIFPPHFCYTLVTYVIEKRAQALYPSYEKILQASGSTLSVQTIIEDEMDHLDSMERELKSHAGIELLIQDSLEFEATLFKHFMERLTA